MVAVERVGDWVGMGDVIPHDFSEPPRRARARL